MKSSTKRVISMLVSMIMIVGSLIIIFSGIRPSMDLVNNKRVILDSKEKVLSEKVQVVENINSLINQLKDEFSELQKSVDLALPGDISLTKVINQIDGASRRSGLSVSLVNFSEERIPDYADSQVAMNLGIIKVRMEIIGSYSGTKNFLSFLENNIRIFDIRNFNTSPDIKRMSEIFERFDNEFEGDFNNLVITDEVFQTIIGLSEPNLRTETEFLVFYFKD